MKKKLLALLLVLSMTSFMPGCNGNDEEPEYVPVIEEELEQKESEDEDEPEVEEPDEEVIELTTVEHFGLSFEAEASWDIGSTDYVMTIIFAEGNVATIQANSIDGMGDLADVWIAGAIGAALQGFADVQERNDFNTEIAGIEALGFSGFVQLGGSWFSSMIVSVAHGDYQYTIINLFGDEVEPSSAFTDMLESISF